MTGRSDDVPHRDKPLIAYGDGSGCLALDWRDAMKTIGATESELLFGWVLENADWLEALPQGAGRATMGGAVMAPHIRRGAVSYAPVRTASMPRMLNGPYRPDLFVVRGRPRGDGFTFCSSIGWSHLAAQRAGAVIVMVDRDFPDLGGPAIEGNVIATVEREFAPFDPKERAPDDEELAIGRTVASLLPSGATIQYGPGGIGTAIVDSLEAPVGVWTGLATGSLVRLVERGMLREPATAGYIYGGPEVVSLAESGAVRLRPVQEIHDIGHVTQIPDFVAINTAIEVALDGSVNVEEFAGRVVAGVGGHADFCAAASYNQTGLSIIALKSQHRGRSTIVPSVSAVSTARIDVDLVVTEHGVADLRGQGLDERARRLVSVADPAHREELTRINADD